MNNLRTLLKQSVAFCEHTLQRGKGDSARLALFASEVGSLLLRCTEDATRLQLDALNGHVASVLQGLTSDERRTFHVVVTGDHQARVRSLAMQYFGKLLGEPAEAENRVTYAEGVTDEKEALALVGTHRLDRAIAGAFFGDPKRLQRDVLGDAVHERLRTLALPPAS